MNWYRVTAGRDVAYTMRAPSITHAAQFTKHWPSVSIRRVKPVTFGPWDSMLCEMTARSTKTGRHP